MQLRTRCPTTWLLTPVPLAAHCCPTHSFQRVEAPSYNAPFLATRDLSGLDEWLMASLGASALLVFALPGSPMAQPWAVIAGNTLSALVGVATIHLVGEPLLAMPLAASLSILGMFVLRCLHPPAAAVALIVVLGHVMHYRYAFFPVMVDSILLVIAGAVYSNLTGKRYPNKPN